MGVRFGIIGLLFFVVILVVVGGGLFALLAGGGKKSSGSKFGIIIAVLAFGMFFLICLGLPMLFYVRMESAEEYRREATREELKQIGEQMRNREQQKASRSQPIPVELKPSTPQKPKSDIPKPAKTTTVKQPSPPPLPKETKPVSPPKAKPIKKQITKETAAVKKSIKIETSPEWIKQNEIKRTNKTYLVLHSDQFATTAEAKADLLEKVTEQLKRQILIDGDSSVPFRLVANDHHCDIYGKQKQGRRYTTDTRGYDYQIRTFGHLNGMGFSKSDGQVILKVPRSALPKYFNKTTWHIPESILRQTLKRQYDETVRRSTEKHEFKMHRLHGQVQITQKELAFAYQTIQEYVTHEEEKIATNNIWKAGSFLGILTLLLGTIATYLRVDTLTNGAYRNRLRLAGAGLVALGTSLGVYLMRLI